MGPELTILRSRVARCSDGDSQAPPFTVWMDIVELPSSKALQRVMSSVESELKGEEKVRDKNASGRLSHRDSSLMRQTHTGWTQGGRPGHTGPVKGWEERVSTEKHITHRCGGLEE